MVSLKFLVKYYKIKFSGFEDGNILNDCIFLYLLLDSNGFVS